jgi:hypothetical protein
MWRNYELDQLDQILRSVRAKRALQGFYSQDDTNCFHAGCLWYEVQRVLRVPGKPGDFRVAFETRVDANEQAALDQLKTWVTSKFGNDFKLVPSK